MYIVHEYSASLTAGVKKYRQKDGKPKCCCFKWPEREKKGRRDLQLFVYLSCTLPASGENYGAFSFLIFTFPAILQEATIDLSALNKRGCPGTARTQGK